MSKAQPNPLPSLVQSFFAQHLTAERQLSPCTAASYRDTFRLLFAYVESKTRRNASAQHLEDWDAPHVLRFLEYVEKQRGCSARTRNARLAALHCFMGYVAQRQPAFLALAGRVLAIPSKRHTQPLLGFLSVEQLQAILEAPTAATVSGRRDRLLFQLLYNTGARVSEMVALNREDVAAGTCQNLALHGKGRKERLVPLWPKTARQLRQWLEQLPPEPSTPVFTNRFGKRLSRFGVEKRLQQAVHEAAKACPSLQGRQISPHIFRHYADLRTMPTGTKARSLDQPSDRALGGLEPALHAA
jgi:integrase/recombinase XerD